MPAWGHSIRRLNPDALRKQIEDANERHATFLANYPEYSGRPWKPGCLTCSVARREPGQRGRCIGQCEADAAFETRHYYITGRAGRVSWAERRLCFEHAERFMLKHKIDPESVTEEFPVQAAEVNVRA